MGHVTAHLRPATSRCSSARTYSQPQSSPDPQRSGRELGLKSTLGPLAWSQRTLVAAAGDASPRCTHRQSLKTGPESKQRWIVQWTYAHSSADCSTRCDAAGLCKHKQSVGEDLGITSKDRLLVNLPPQGQQPPQPRGGFSWRLYAWQRRRLWGRRAVRLSRSPLRRGLSRGRRAS